MQNNTSTVDNNQPAVQPQPAAPAEANPGQSEFFKELHTLPPKPATVPGSAPGADVPPPDSTAPASEGTPAKDIKDFFGKDFLKNITGKKDTPVPEAQPETTAQGTPSGAGASAGSTDQPRSFFPKDEPAPQPGVQPNSPPPADVMDNYLFMEEVKNTALAALLAMRSGIPAKNYTLDEEQVQRLAKAAAKMKVKFIEEMDGGTQYIALNAMIYVPMVMRAEQIRTENLRNARIRKQPAPATDAMPDFFSNKANAGPVANSKGTRTRFDIHNDGTYMYTRLIPGQKTQYLKKGDPNCERVDLSDTAAIRGIVLKMGDWQKVAEILKVSQQWMAERGLNTNNPD